MSIPYVLTDDLKLVFDQFAATSDINDALENAAKSITASIATFTPRVDRIQSERMRAYLADQTANHDLPIISMTALLPTSKGKVFEVESSRSIRLEKDGNGTYFADAGVLPRNMNAPPLQAQFERAAADVRKLSKTIDIADDVVFSGSTVCNLIDYLNGQGVSVRNVIATVALKEAQAKQKTRDVGIIADYVYDDVIDEVCMRDFVVAAPGGGRNLVMPDHSTLAAVPYLFPFGAADVWASIPKSAAPAFSAECLRASQSIWNKIGPETRFGALDKPVFLCAPDECITTKLTELLEAKSYEKPACTLRL